MIKRGHPVNSVHVKQLSTITGNSTQICRKYLKGDGLPALDSIINIAKKLHVSPHWLMFGEDFKSHDHQTKSITISKDVLRYIFEKYVAFLRLKKDKKIEDIASFFTHMTEVISLINDCDDNAKKFIDIALLSTKL